MNTAPVDKAAKPVQLDHLVVAARTLDEGVAWCEATLGVVPGPGGEHALFGTHNRLLKLDCDGAPQAYLEIIATHPTLQPARQAPLKRWFDLDDPTLQQALATQGPQLTHWVASVPDLLPAHAACLAQGLDPGRILAASRPTPAGLLQWQITVRDDGRRLGGGSLPTLIQWGDTHPASTMPSHGLRLRRLQVAHPEAARLKSALKVPDWPALDWVAGEAALLAELDTPAGPVFLRSNPTSPSPCTCPR